MLGLCLVAGILGKLFPRAEQPDTRPQLGDDVIVNRESFVAVDDSAFDAITKASVARDEFGVRRLIASGKVFVVAKGTRARKIDSGIFSNKIRILEDKHIGKAGWIAVEFIDKAD